MASPVRYRINSPIVTGEVIDGEVVIIHLDNGNYFSLLDVGERIWQQLVESETLENIVRDLTMRYVCEASLARSSLERLVAELVAEELIVPREPDSVAPAPTNAILASGALPERKAFVEPALQKFTDMQNLLMVDPIHEVTDQGWPVKAEGGTPPGRPRS